MKDLDPNAPGYDISFRDLPKSLSSDELRPVAESFVLNLDQITLLNSAPRDIAYHAYKYGRAEYLATCSLLNKITFTQDEVNQNINAIDQRSKELFLADLEFHSPNNSWVISGNIVDKIAKWDVEVGGLALVNNSVIIWLWTAFESFSEDLWKVAVNRGPKRLAKKIVKAAVNGKNLNAGTDSESKSARKAVSYQTLAEFGFDLRNRMGDVLKKEKRVGFDTSEAMEAAYLTVFADKCKAVFELAAYENVRGLEQLRHVLAHRAGVADLKFKTKIDKLKGFPIQYRIGERIEIDRKVCILIWNSVIAVATSLLEVVDLEVSPSATQ